MTIFPSEEYKAVLLGTLRTLGIQKIFVDFSGSGDSGSINAVYCNRRYGEDKEKLLQTRIIWPTTTSILNKQNHKWEDIEKLETLTLENVIEKVTYTALEHSNLDWYNNEGGQGELSIDFEQSPPEITLNVGINETHVTEHNFDFTFEED